MEKIISPEPINNLNFSEFGEVITTKNIKPLEINNGYAQRFDGIANLDTKEQNGETTISISVSYTHLTLPTICSV